MLPPSSQNVFYFGFHLVIPTFKDVFFFTFTLYFLTISPVPKKMFLILVSVLSLLKCPVPHNEAKPWTTAVQLLIPYHHQLELRQKRNSVRMKCKEY